MPSPAPQDAQAIMADMRRRHRRARAWFYFFLLLMPLGLVIPCTLAYFVPDENAKQYLAMAGFGLPLIGLIFSLLIGSDRSQYKRQMAVAEQSERMSMPFAGRAREVEYERRLASLTAYGNADSPVSVGNLLVGEMGGTPVALMESAFAIGSGRYRSFYNQTVVVLPDAAEGMKDFIVFRKNWRVKLSEFLRLDNPIEVPGQPAFNKQFTLNGEDREEVASYFTPEVVEQLMAEEAPTVEVQGGALVVQQMGKRADPTTYPQLVDNALCLASAFQAAGQGLA